MKKIFCQILLLQLAVFAFCQKQAIDTIIVETYYEANAADTMPFTLPFDTIAFQSIPLGSKTYRVYIDLKKDVNLLRVFGSKEFPFEISTTTEFHNYNPAGIGIGSDFGNKVATGRFINIYPIDSWLTIGFATSTHVGILKQEDTDALPKFSDLQGYLTNNSAAMGGLPLSEVDGLVEKPEGFTASDIGAVNIQNTYDSLNNPIMVNSIFEGESKKSFKRTGISNTDNPSLICAKGFVGPTSSNRILIAQLTTDGEIHFKFNIEVQFPNGEKAIYYHSDKEFEEKNPHDSYNPYLSFPTDATKLSGCTNPKYTEYRSYYNYDNGTCLTPVVFGCLDTLACNYNKNANYHLSDLCCYSSECKLNLNIVCPDVKWGCKDTSDLNFDPAATHHDEKYCAHCISGQILEAGCKNDKYFEYGNYCVSDNSQCKTLKIADCMDKLAANYNPIANIMNNEECIYTIDSSSAPLKFGTTALSNFQIYPLPSSNIIFYSIETKSLQAVSIEIVNHAGKQYYQEELGFVDGAISSRIDISQLSAGLYYLKVKKGSNSSVQLFIKE